MAKVLKHHRTTVCFLCMASASMDIFIFLCKDALPSVSFLKFYLFEDVYLWLCALEPRGPQRPEALAPLELELQVEAFHIWRPVFNANSQQFWMLRISNCECSAVEGTSMSKGLRGHLGGGGWKNVRSRGWGGELLHTWTHKFCGCRTRPPWDQKFKHGAGRGFQSPTPHQAASGNWWLLLEGDFAWGWVDVSRMLIPQ